jgi:glutamate transport system substrate-binding protein
LCCVGAALLGACSNNVEQVAPNGSAVKPAPTVVSGSTLDRIEARGRVIIGVKFDVPLFGLQDPQTKSLSGFDIEIAKMVAGELFPNEPDVASRIEFVEALSKDRETFLQSGTVDLVISTYTITESRKQFVDFAGPYYIAGQDILARAADIASGKITGVSSLNGKKVCAVTGSTSLGNLVAAAPQADTSVTAERYPECFAALQEGRVDAMTTDDVILLGLAQQAPGTFQITGNPFHTEPYGIGVPKGDSALQLRVNTALADAFQDGRWKSAFQTTVGRVGAAVPQPPALQGSE